MKSIKTNVIAESFFRILFKKGINLRDMKRKYHINSSMTHKMAVSNLDDKSLFTVNGSKKLGRGLGLSDKQLNKWIATLQNRTNSRYRPIEPKKIIANNHFKQPYFANTLPKLMKDKHMSALDLSNKLGMTKANLYRLKSKGSVSAPKIISIVTVRQFAKALGLTHQQLVNWVTLLKGGHISKLSGKTFNQTIFSHSVAKVMAKKQLSAQQICDKISMPINLFYRLTSANNPRHSVITYQTASKIGKGLGFNPKQTDEWLGKILKAETPKPAKPTVKAPSTLSDAINGIMSKRNLTLDQVVAKTGLNAKRLQQVVNGTIKVMPVLSIYRLAQGLNIDPKPLLKFKGTPQIQLSAFSNSNNASNEASASSNAISNSNSVSSEALNQQSSTSSLSNAQSQLSSNQNISSKGTNLSPSGQLKLLKNKEDHVKKEIIKHKQPSEDENKPEPKPQVQSQPKPQFRPIVFHTAKDLSKLTDADVSIVDLMVQRLLHAHYRH